MAHTELSPQLLSCFVPLQCHLYLRSFHNVRKKIRLEECLKNKQSGQKKLLNRCEHLGRKREKGFLSSSCSRLNQDAC